MTMLLMVLIFQGIDASRLAHKLSVPGSVAESQVNMRKSEPC